MDVKIQARAKALHERHGARVQLAGLTALLCRLLVMARQLLGVDTRKRPEHLGLRRREQRQFERERQHELPNRYCGQDAVDKVKLRRYHQLGVRELLFCNVDEIAGKRLRAWDLIDGDLVERVVERDTTPCLSLGDAYAWTIARAEQWEVALRLMSRGEIVALDSEKLEATSRELEKCALKWIAPARRQRPRVPVWPCSRRHAKSAEARRRTDRYALLRRRRHAEAASDVYKRQSFTRAP